MLDFTVNAFDVIAVILGFVDVFCRRVFTSCETEVKQTDSGLAQARMLVAPTVQSAVTEVRTSKSVASAIQRVDCTAEGLAQTLVSGAPVVQLAISAGRLAQTTLAEGPVSQNVSVVVITQLRAAGVSSQETDAQSDLEQKRCSLCSESG